MQVYYNYHLIISLSNIINSILLIDPIRAVILRHACLIFVPDGADSLLSILKEEFTEYAKDTKWAFEMRAMEAILRTLCRVLLHEVHRLEPEVTKSLDRLVKATWTAGELERIRTIKNTVSVFDSQVLLILYSMSSQYFV